MKLLGLLLRLFYGFRAFNEASLKAPGPVLLLPNHVSWWDWLLLAVCLDDDWRFVTSRRGAERSWLHRRVMINRRTFPIDPLSPYAMKHMAEYLQTGGRLVLFPEGRLSRTGSLMKLFDGTGFLLFKAHAKVITAYLRGAERLPLSPHPGWKKWFPRISVHFSDAITPPVPKNVSTTEARYRLTHWLRDQMVRQQFEVETAFGPDNPLDVLIETARRRPSHVALEDTTFQKLTYRRLLVGVDLMARQWRKLLPDSTGHVGVLLPNVNAAPVTVLSLWAAGKVPAVLNFSTGTVTMLACAQLAGLKHIITSRAFIERFKLDLAPFEKAGLQFLFLEDMRRQITSTQKLGALLRRRFVPRSAFRAPQSPDSTAVVLFTSGSEGTPKGVELTHRNLLANIRQMLSVIDVVDTDRVFNALPLFHSFGLVIATLLPLLRGIYVFLYPSPLHYRVVPNSVYNLDCTIMFGTNTFLNGYARKAHPYDFRSLRYLFAGAEKVQEETMRSWMQRFGVRILEGYGATECGPCLSANVPLQPRPGSAGRFLPGIEHRLEPVEGVEQGGRLFVRGPNVMRGYVNPDANEKFKALGGWYDTGDIVHVDGDGFVHILGRLKRFAKVSGEMVSLAAVEDALAGAFPHYGLRCQIAVLAQPDADKGEKLIAVTNEPKLQLDEIRGAIKAKGLANLCVPREIRVVKEIPKLGTGKVNHRELVAALQQTSPA